MKFSIITPSYNAEKTIRETIESVLSQKGDFEIEYFVMDGLSSDKTAAIAREYTAKDGRVKVISEKDRGMYDAINKGFAKATGDIYAYINADDVYEPGAFAVIAKTLEKYPDILWLKGAGSVIDEKSNRLRNIPCYLYNQKWIKRGIYGRNAPFINQESVFWKSSLWKAAGPIDSGLRLAGDYYLWLQFAKHCPLWSLRAEVARFRIIDNQLSRREVDVYNREKEILSKTRGFLDIAVKLFFWLRSKSPAGLERLFLGLYCLIFRISSEYIDFEESGKPVKKKTCHFMV